VKNQIKNLVQRQRSIWWFTWFVLCIWLFKTLV